VTRPGRFNLGEDSSVSIGQEAWWTLE